MITELYEHWDLPKAVDILAYTPEEFNRLMLENHFVMDAVQQGVLLYDAARDFLDKIGEKNEIAVPPSPLPEDKL